MRRLRRVCGLVLLALFIGIHSVSAAGFKDVHSSSWFYKDVMKLTEQGILTGFEDGTFRPNQQVTRVQMAVIVAGASLETIETPFTPKFVDIPTEHWGYKYVASLTEIKVLENTTEFRPLENLTRAELAKVLVEALDIPKEGTSRFADVPPTAWYADYINALAATGITAGKSATTFDPTGEVTRAEIAAFVNRALHYQRGELTPPSPGTGLDLSMYPTQEIKDLALSNFNLVNKEREKLGLLPMTWDPEMARFSQWKAEDMRNRNYFAHNGPGGSSDTMAEQAKRFGVEYRFLSENIAKSSFIDINRIFNGWMTSEGHRANILRDYKNQNGQRVPLGFGFGYAKAKDGSVLWVNNFRSN